MAGYLKHGGYRALRKVLKKMEPKDVVEEVKDSGLRGRGGAGFPTGLKWSFMPQETDGPKYIACNADEAEPGTFKAREFLEKEPQMMIEGLIISAYAMGVNTCYIFIRGEYATQTKLLQQALAEAYEEKFLGRNILGAGFDCDSESIIRNLALSGRSPGRFAEHVLHRRRG